MRDHKGLVKWYCIAFFFFFFATSQSLLIPFPHSSHAYFMISLYPTRECCLANRTVRDNPSCHWVRDSKHSGQFPVHHSVSQL